MKKRLHQWRNMCRRGTFRLTKQPEGSGHPREACVDLPIGESCVYVYMYVSMMCRLLMDAFEAARRLFKGFLEIDAQRPTAFRPLCWLVSYIVVTVWLVTFPCGGKVIT